MSPSVRGRVGTPDGWPLPGSIVTVVGPRGEQVGRVAVGETGEFVVAVDGAQAVTVVVTAPGADPVARTVSVAPDGAGDLGTVVLGSSARAELPAAGVWSIDPVHSVVRATARHLSLSTIDGRFRRFAGEVHVVRPIERSRVEVAIDADALDTGSDERDTHLRSPDFLDTERFPQLLYRSTTLAQVARERWRMDGVLTIRDISRAVSLDVRYLGTSADLWGGTRMAFTASTALALRDYAMSWNMSLPDGLAFIGPTLRVHLDVEAVLTDRPGGTVVPGGAKDVVR
jgi:polyisoprenoid-binding protein YceI